MKTQTDKRLEAKGDLKEKEKLIQLAKDQEDIIFDIESEIIDSLNRAHKEEAPEMSFSDWLRTKDKDYLLRLPLGLNKGGVVVSISDYMKQREKPKIKKLNLDSVAPNKAIADLTDAELAVVRQLLKMTFGEDK
jgi:hypothetical protein